LEIEMGITREDEIEGVDGAMAVRLWHQWERHQDKDALDILIEYNRADTVDLETIAERIYKRLVTDYAGYRW
ncbi:MAG: ribonuclease H-like domain-containing protein, partial [Candidatus Methanomethylophilaceae archaeon]|nr:ribonuclease H-like domain-containing protein [Candidatus Methanomethylophilaceae archaeon]